MCQTSFKLKATRELRELLSYLTTGITSYRLSGFSPCILYSFCIILLLLSNTFSRYFLLLMSDDTFGIINHLSFLMKGKRLINNCWNSRLIICSLCISKCIVYPSMLQVTDYWNKKHRNNNKKKTISNRPFSAGWLKPVEWSGTLSFASSFLY